MSCKNNVNSLFCNKNISASYATDYIKNKKSKLFFCNDEKNVECKIGFTQNEYLLHKNAYIRKNCFSAQCNKNCNEKNLENDNVICAVGQDVDSCTSPTKINSSNIPFYSYFKILHT